jgi:hypothetical protein
MVEKILRTNHKEVNEPTVPVTNNIAAQINPMYPKYKRYVMTIFDGSRERNQKML